MYALAATVLYLGAGQPLCAARDEAAMLLEIGTSGVRADLLARTSFRGVEREALALALALDPRERITDARALAAVFDGEGCA